MAKKQRDQKKPKLVKKPYILIKDVPVGDRLYKKGSTIRLTEQGKEYFKSIHNI